jgi:hypothetical protein
MTIRNASYRVSLHDSVDSREADASPPVDDTKRAKPPDLFQDASLMHTEAAQEKPGA